MGIIDKESNPLLNNLNPGSWSIAKAMSEPMPGDVGIIRTTGVDKSSKGYKKLVRILSGGSNNDGVLTVGQQTLPGARSVVDVPLGHTGVLAAPSTADKIINFLERGSF